MTKNEVLQATSFGKRVAEEEEEQLKYYFVETSQWRKIINDDIDVLYGTKGSGKSAIYSLLLSRESDLLKNRIIIVPAEKPGGTPIFKDLLIDPPTSEIQFQHLWKVYFLMLMISHMRKERMIDRSIKKIIKLLEEEELLSKDDSMIGKLRRAVRYVSHIPIKDIEAGTIKIDPHTGAMTGVSLAKVTLREPSVGESARGFTSVDMLIGIVDKALSNAGFKMWLALDRLDVAFAQSDELEGNALRALFSVYRDLAQLKNIRLKIFLRSDIWQRITKKRVSEASHITRSDLISWNDQSLLKLVISRVLHNEPLREFYEIDEADITSILKNQSQQQDLFYRIFPHYVVGNKTPETFDWILNHTRDALNPSSPGSWFIY
jgi:hypothetical protein